MFFTFVSVIITFLTTGVFNDKIDTQDYVEQIQQFEDGTFFNPGTAILNRVFKPFYGFVGAIFTGLGSSYYSAILIINIVFLLGLIACTYHFIRLLGYKKHLAIVGAAWVAFGYPVLKYGIALGTDISGWFFALLSIILILKFNNNENYKLLLVASFVGFVGGLAKETAVLGLIFGGLYILMQFKKWPVGKIFKSLLSLAAPVLVLGLYYLHFLQQKGFPGFFDWYQTNLKDYAESHYKLFYFVGTEASAFNVILLLSVAGLIIAFLNRDIFKQKWASIHVSLFIATLPVLLWPIFITRIIYIQFLFMIPLAIYAVSKIENETKNNTLRGLRYLLYALPPIASIILFLVSRDQSLFALLSNLL